MAVSLANTAVDQSTFNGASPVTFTAESIGATAADRVVLVGIQNFDFTGTSTFISGVTIGGVTANAVAEIDDGSLQQTVFYWATLNASFGTTADIVVSIPGASFSNLAIFVYRIVGASTTTPVDSSSTALGSNNSPTASVTIPSGGALVALGAEISTGFVILDSWSGATADQEQGYSIISARADIVTAISTVSGSHTVSPTWTSDPSIPALLSVIVFKQAGNVTDKTLAITQGEAVALGVFRSKRLTLTQGESVSLVKSVNRFIVIRMGQVASLVRSASKICAVQMGELVALLAGVPRSSTISIVSSQIVSLIKFRGGPKSIAMTNAQVVLANRRLIKVFNLTSAQLVRLAHPIQRIIHVVQSQVVMLLAHAVSGSHSLVHLLANTVRRIRSLKNRIDRVRTISNTNARRKP